MRDDYRILLVEQNPPSSARLRNWLHRQKYRVLSAATGKEALEKIRKETLDLVLWNRSTGDSNGLELARILRRQRGGTRLPIIMLRPRGKQDREGIETEVDDFILRPLRFEEVGVRIRTILKKQKEYSGLQQANLRLKKANGRLKKILAFDAKTQLYNYRYFSERVEEEFKRAERYDNFLSCIILDLDRFKGINDRFGHLEGDQVLRTFAAILLENARETDFVARYGGEEFAIILVQTDGPQAKILAERIREATEKFSFLPSRRNARLTVSAGIATFPSNSRIHSSTELVKAADTALFRAKEAGRNRTHLDRSSETAKIRKTNMAAEQIKRRRKTIPS